MLFIILLSSSAEQILKVYTSIIACKGEKYYNNSALFV